MKLSFFDVDEFSKLLQAVTSSKVLSKKGFNEEGLFSEKIFGPVKTATCGCGIYHGRSRIGRVCNQCGRKISYSSDRRNTFSKIELPFPILNPIMYYLVIKAGKNKAQDLMDNLLFNDKIFGYLYDKEKKRYILYEKKFKEKESDDDEEAIIPEGQELLQGLSGIKRFVDLECEDRKENDKNWKYVFDALPKFYLNNILIMPPEFRPMSKNKDGQMQDELNHYYTIILNFANLMKDDHASTTLVTGISDINFRNLQRHVFSLYTYIFKKLSKKSGLIRGYILGKRVDYSGRAVICPDPDLKVDECSIPYLMALELYKLEVANLLIEKREFKRYDRAIEYIDECLQNYNYSLYDYVCSVSKDKFVILNRQPTLHRMGMMSFRVFINKDYVIKIHPLVCEPYNADFDGDQMACYRPLYDDTEEECKKILSVNNNLLSPTSGSLILGVNQDVVLGLYLLTEDKNYKHCKFPENMTKKIFGQKEYTTEGRILFNSILPEKYAFINETITKKVLKLILDDITKIYFEKSSDAIISILDNIKKIGFENTTKYGITMSLKNMNIHNIINQDVDNVVDDPKLNWSEKMEMLKSESFLKKVKENFPYSVFIDSGSRGSWDQATQIISTRGYISNFKGDIIPVPIKNNLISGLTQEEFFRSCYGSRKGLLDTALNTGDSGYLTRKLVYCGCNIEHDINNEDCGTKRTLKITIPEKIENGLDPIKLLKSLIGRYIVTQEDSDGTQHFKKITYYDYDKYIGQTIYLRSPIFCQSDKICKKCYGDTSNILHSKFVGIIAAQALGEVATQMVLRTFHTSGAARKAAVVQESKDEESKSDDIVYGLSKVKKVFHCTADLNYYHSLLELFKMYSDYSSILLIHYECIISQMMRLINKPERWRMSGRGIEDCEMVSIDAVPSRESWLLALAFSKPKTYIIDGLVGETSSSNGILERIMTNQKF